MEEERAGSGITKMVGSGRKRGKVCNMAQYFVIKKNCKEAGANKYRAARTGIKEYGKREV